jgi:1,4-alpha-glucan branching enzyme
MPATTDPAGFAWIDLHSSEQSVYAFLRRDPQRHHATTAGMRLQLHTRAAGMATASAHPKPAPIARSSTAMPHDSVVLPTTSRIASRQTRRRVTAYPCSLRIDLPPLGAILLEPDR